ncbi:HAD family hydrolase [Streptomyces sp. adm13(2018)]|uniref:HAD family hydrolase n=1 Tax=Streptomyces sp. adm13(2018) TaxID=2479007 RepID=UPI0011CEB59E|nr:HAD family hydrolase [Streptomyces sp. adm13(2018)]TXS13978.1 HAD family hydrolase [Streptomyces sp. adm13(2018)]
MSSEALAAVLADCDAILFDFDGPICHVFRGLPAPEVAKDLSALLATLAPQLADAAHSTDDPMVVHQLAREGGRDVLTAVEAALTDAEVRAVVVAGEPMGGAVEAMIAARSSGRRVAVVSNNSGDCVHAYLAAQGLTGAVEVVVGRPVLRPDLMKPSPHPLLEAAAALGVSPSRSALVGDSVTDIEAARAAGAGSIGFANKHGKREALTAAGAGAVVTDMRSIASAFVAT